MTYTVPADGGTPTNAILPPGVTVAQSATAKYTVTVTDAPYYQCVHSSAVFIQATRTPLLGIDTTVPANGTGNTSTVTFFDLTNGTNTEPTQAAVVSHTLRFRKTGVP